MKVRELIEQLSRVNPDLTVVACATTGSVEGDLSHATIRCVDNHGPWIGDDGETCAVWLQTGTYIETDITE